MNDSVLPTVCPSCSYKLEFNLTKVDLFCYNPICSAKNTRQILHFFQTLNNLDGFGPKTIEILLEFGFDTIPKIYNMNYADFQDCGYKHKTIMNLGSELEGSKERLIEPYRFIAALGINHLGIGSSKKLLEHYDYIDILELKYSDYIIIDGFGSKTSEEIPEEIYERFDEIESIFNIGFNAKEEKIKVKESSITGKRICFTGSMVNNRKEMQKNAESLGAISVGGVNSKTDILVCGNKVGKNKTDAAKKFETLVLSEQEYYNLIG